MTVLVLLAGCANGSSSADQYTGFANSSGSALGADAGGSEDGAGDDGTSTGDGSAFNEGGAAGEGGSLDDAAGSGDDGGGSSGGGNDGGVTASDGPNGSMDTGNPTGDASTPVEASDKCARYSDTCGDCTQGRSGYNCGWCNGCFTGTSSGPTSAGICAGATWVWRSSNCP